MISGTEADWPDPRVPTAVAWGWESLFQGAWVQSVQGRGDEEPMKIPKEGILPQESLGCPEDVARMVVFLASDDARFLTGSEFVVDNGLLARPADIVQ